MKDYQEFPPFTYFMRVLKNCPKSALLYLQIYKKKKPNLQVITIAKREIRKEYLISPTLFRNLLIPVMFLNLISFVEKADRFEIDILGPQINA